MPRERDGLATRKELFAWALYDFANSAFSAVIQTFVFAAYFTRRVAEDEATGSAQWGTAIGLAGLITALGGPILGSVADQLGRRKQWIAVLTLVSVTAIGLLWFVTPSPESVLPALVLVGIASFTSEFANLFYNAMLPGLAGSARMGRWSGWAWGLGYLGGLGCLVLALFAFIGPEPWFPLDTENAQDIRAVFPLVAGWYLLFALPLLLFTPEEPGLRHPIRGAVTEGFRRLVRTFREIRQRGPLFRFLVAHLIYTDGLAGLFAFGGVYAAGTLDMTERDVLAFGIALNISAGIGAFGLAWLADWRSSKTTVIVSLSGLILFGAALLQVDDVALFWTFGVLLGLFVGPVQAASRSYLGHLAPPELRNQMFGLYALSGKATAFLAPILIGWLTYAADSQRVGMSVLLVYFALGLLLMLRVPTDRPR